MKIVGEKINGTRKAVKKAVLGRDAEAITQLAKDQADAGAAWLDVNAGTPPDREPEDLAWLAETVQAAVDTPLCLDSTNNEALEAALAKVEKTPLINSISGEPYRLEGTLPLGAERGCPFIALAMDESGIPKDVDGRLEAARKILEKTRAAGVKDSDIFLDPLVTAVATEGESGNMVWEFMDKVRAEAPEVKFAMGLSNISFGLPARSLVNRAFLSVSLSRGLDAAILDPNDRGLMETLYATQAILGRDRFCMEYSRAYRAGKIGQVKKD